MLTTGLLKAVAQASQLPHRALPYDWMGHPLGADGDRDLIGGVAGPTPDRQRISTLPLVLFPVALRRYLQVPDLHPAPPDHHSISRQFAFELRFVITQPACLAIAGYLLHHRTATHWARVYMALGDSSHCLTASGKPDRLLRRGHRWSGPDWAASSPRYEQGDAATRLLAP